MGGPERGAERAEVDRDHARCVRGVDEGVDTQPVELTHDRLDRKDDAARAGDVADQGDTRPRRDCSEVRLDDLLGVSDREGNVNADDARPRALRDGIELVVQAFTNVGQ